MGDWDTPVKYETLTRASLVNITKIANINNLTLDDITNAQIAFNLNNVGTVTKESFFPDADKFFEHAQPRQLAFVDPIKVIPFPNYS